MKAHNVLGHIRWSMASAAQGAMTSLSMALGEAATGVLCRGFSPLCKRDVRSLVRVQQRAFETFRY